MICTVNCLSILADHIYTSGSIQAQSEQLHFECAAILTVDISPIVMFKNFHRAVTLKVKTTHSNGSTFEPTMFPVNPVLYVEEKLHIWKIY